MELNKDPELVFLDDCIKLMADLNERTRVMLLEYDIIKGLLVPPSAKRNEVSNRVDEGESHDC